MQDGQVEKRFYTFSSVEGLEDGFNSKPGSRYIYIRGYIETWLLHLKFFSSFTHSVNRSHWETKRNRTESREFISILLKVISSISSRLYAETSSCHGFCRRSRNCDRSRITYIPGFALKAVDFSCCIGPFTF